ncbi:MAG TPA: ATP-binding protein [Candidatus Baltobacteraceae bacterium]|jgi:anti-sigma regulatory factor (Ser/Thr protein kinase)
MTLLQMRVPAEPWHVRTLRDELLQVGEEVEMHPEVLEDFVTAVGEAFANAIEHALSAEPVEIEVKQRDAHLVATVRDHGRGIDSTRISSTLPPASAERGRGIPLMRKCSSSMSIQKPQDGGTLVVLNWDEKRLHGAPVSNNGTILHTIQ